MDHGPMPGEPGGETELDEAREALRIVREREVLLRNELAHRVRNILGLTRSIFSRTVETADTLEHARDHFFGRLDAVARYHGVSAGSPEATFDLEAMLYDELLVVHATDDPRVSIEGSEVHLRSRFAEALGLAFHELTTNAIKFGALADPNGPGRLRIRWTITDEVLDFSWVESGIAIVARAPRTVGFGQQYIEQALPYQLGGETRFDIVPGGLNCRIRLPLGTRLARPGTF